jgi:hypothetical protein
VHVVDANYTTLTIVFAGVAASGYDPTDVEARAEQAIADLINPARWGAPAAASENLAPAWVNTPVVRFQDISAALNNVEGFDHWTSLTINGGTADVTMNGIAPLPSAASTVSGTVT